jgi:transposase
MRFVPVKTIEQQDIQSLHRARSRLVNDRTGLVSQMRAILAERGIVFPKSITRARRQIPLILADQDNELSAMTRSLLVDLLEQLSDLDRRIGLMDRRILCVFRTLEPCQRLAKIGGVGPITATAMVAAIGDGSDFKNGRHLAAWLASSRSIAGRGAADAKINTPKSVSIVTKSRSSIGLAAGV